MRLQSKGNFSRPQLLLFVIAFSLIGFIIIKSFATTPTLPGDITGDGHVDSTDLGFMIANYNTVYPAADFNNSGKVDGSDFATLLKYYGTSSPTPTASLSASPASITSGQSSTLTWNSSNSTSCTASGAWSGSKATSGSQSVSPTTTSTYTITCSGAGGTSTPVNATVTVSSGSTFVPGACGAGGCTASTVHGFNIIVPNASAPPFGTATGTPTSCSAVGPGCATRNFQIYRPNNLLTNPKPPLVIAFSGSIGNNPQWYADAVSRGYVVAIIFNVHDNGAPSNNLQYTFPTVSFTPPATGFQTTCGADGASMCDDMPQVMAVLNDLNCPYVSGGSASLCQGYNTGEVFVEGGSKGGLATEAVACDTRSSTKIAGVSVISNTLISTGSTAAVGPNCPAILGVQSNCVSDCVSVAANKKLALQFLWGTNDPNYQNGSVCSVSTANDCLGTGYVNAKGLWAFGTVQLATSVFGSVFGCSQTPSTNTTTGQTGKIITKTYKNCTNPNQATQTVDVSGGLHMPDTWPCNSLSGNVCASGTDFAKADGLSEPAAAWNFWTAFFP